MNMVCVGHNNIMICQSNWVFIYCITLMKCTQLSDIDDVSDITGCRKNDTILK